jgi:hypothetical protein
MVKANHWKIPLENAVKIFERGAENPINTQPWKHLL